MVFFRRQTPAVPQPQEGAARNGALQDGDCLELAGIEVVLRVNSRARRISLRLDTSRQQIIATAPSNGALVDAAAFARQRQAWIQAKIQTLPARRDLAPGTSLEILGQTCRLQQGGGARAPAQWCQDGGDLILICGAEGDGFSRAVLRALKAKALSVLQERTYVHAKALDQPLPTVAVMDAKGRWGSCKPSPSRGFGALVTVGQIRYSWRLIMAPYEVLDYVAAHECAHLVEANHGPRFWNQVKGLIGDPRHSRAWLRQYGRDLHAIG